MCKGRRDKHVVSSAWGENYRGEIKSKVQSMDCKVSNEGEGERSPLIHSTQEDI